MDTSEPLPAPVRRRTRKRKACVQCTKAKRKCDKIFPRCKRCLERGDRCKYRPLAHIFPTLCDPSNHQQLGNPDRQSEDENDGTDITLTNPFSPECRSVLIQGGPLNAQSSSSTLSIEHPPGSNVGNFWFLSSQSWKRQYTLDPGEPLLPVAEEDLPQFVSHLQSWTKTWIADGHSPLMHRHLYRSHMPECVQDAFTALTAYHNATPNTRHLVLRIITDRANRLIRSYQHPPHQAHQQQPQSPFHPVIPSFTETTLPTSLTAPCVILDTATHLARVQALFVYQLVRLFDGDIRGRVQAEEHMEVLQTWAAQMFESARLDCVAAEYTPGMVRHNPSTEQYICDGTFNDNASNNLGDNLNSNPNTNSNIFLQAQATAPTTSDPSQIWQAWILSESIRRVFLVATYMQGVYMIIKRGWCLCPGGVAFTPAAGLWDAPSTWGWLAKARREIKLTRTTTMAERQGVSIEEVELLPLLCDMDAWVGLKKRKAEEVDDFTHVVLGVCDNRRWGSL